MPYARYNATGFPPSMKLDASRAKGGPVIPREVWVLGACGCLGVALTRFGLSFSYVYSMDRMMKYRLFLTDWGHFGMVELDNKVLATYLPGKQEKVRQRIQDDWPGAIESKSILTPLCRQVKKYFNGSKVRFSVSLDLSHLSPFRGNVLKACQRIPYGQTASYADLARVVGSPHAARAVGSAMAHNPLPLLVPCHRVLCSDGTIGGFSSPNGIREKERLLRLEGALNNQQMALAFGR